MDASLRPRWKRRYLRWLPAAAWALVIFAGSSMPGSSIPGGSWSVLGHLGEYFVLGALVSWALRRDDWGTVLLVLGLCALYGATDEFHQAFVPLRTPDVVDWATDVAGAAIGVAAHLLWTLRRDARRDASRRQ
ncbi:MAG TPA: VanZ family protein [Coriobacteriia bacterium]